MPNSDEKAKNQLIQQLNSLNPTQKRYILEAFNIIQQEKHRKKLKSARNKRHYLKNRTNILAKQKIANQLMKEFMVKAKLTI